MMIQPQDNQVLFFGRTAVFDGNNVMDDHACFAANIAPTHGVTEKFGL
jgi:hypothetical protein